MAAVYHFANGLGTAAITWGLTVTTTAQHRWGMACAAIGAGLAAAGLTAILGFTCLDVGEAEAVEQEMLQMKSPTASVAVPSEN
jgi:succinate dehydrogenase / fumarate reductase cytochrome b subunit